MTSPNSSSNAPNGFASPKMPSRGKVVELLDEKHVQQWRNRMLAAYPEKRSVAPDGPLTGANSRTFVLRPRYTEVGYIRIIDVTDDVPPLPCLPKIWMVSEAYVLPRWQADGRALITLMRYVLDHADTHIAQFKPTSKNEEGFMALCGYPVFVAQLDGRQRALSPTYAVASGAITFN